MKKKRIDFDRLIAENEKDTIEILFKGELFYIPTEVPAKVVLILLSKDKDEMLTNAEVLELLQTIIPEDTFRKLCDLGMSINDFERLLTELMFFYKTGLPSKDIPKEQRIGDNEEENFINR